MLNRNKENLVDGNNKAIIIGRFTNEFKYSHNRNGRDFYRNTMEVTRRDGKIENITIIANESFMYRIYLTKGKYAIVKGSIITLQETIEMQKKTYDVCIFANQIEICKGQINDKNFIYLEGTIEKQAVITKGHNTIKYIWLISVGDEGRQFKIPCKFYKNEAKAVKRLKTGTLIQLEGQVECRNKLNLLEDGSVELKIIHYVKAIRFNKK